MNTENVWIVILLLVIILLGSNAVVFGIVRGWSGGKSNWFKNTTDKFTQPWGAEDKDWNELSQRVRALKKDQDSAPKE